MKPTPATSATTNPTTDNRSEHRYLEQEDAARLIQRSLDTIRKARRDGKLPNSRTNEQGKIEVSIVDLINAGMLDPTAAALPVDEFVGKSRLERDLTATRTDLAVALARLDDAFRQIHSMQEILIVRVTS